MPTPEEEDAARVAPAQAAALKTPVKKAKDEPAAPRQFIALREFTFQPPPNSAEVVRARVYSLGSRINEAELPSDLIRDFLDNGTLGVAKRVNRSLPEAVLAMVEGNQE